MTIAVYVGLANTIYGW